MTRRGVVALLLALGAILLTSGLIYGHSDLHRLGANCGSALGGANRMSIMTADLERAFTELISRFGPEATVAVLPYGPLTIPYVKPR